MILALTKIIPHFPPSYECIIIRKTGRFEGNIITFGQKEKGGVQVDILIFVVYIALLSVAVNKFAGKKRHRWIHSGYITAFLLPVLALFLALRIVGALTGDGIAGGVAGFGYAIATSITGFVILYIGYTSKALQDD